jgi:hypothetical protein
MESVGRSRIELILEEYEKYGKVKTYSLEESTKMFEAIDDRLREVRAEVRQLEFASRADAEKIILTGFSGFLGLLD